MTGSPTPRKRRAMACLVLAGALAAAGCSDQDPSAAAGNSTRTTSPASGPSRPATPTPTASPVAPQGYAKAVREHVKLPLGFDDDGDGQPDTLSMDIVRPAGSEKVPTIMQFSPYYAGLGRGKLGELKKFDMNGVITQTPLFYDNWFVPRGYAVATVDVLGTGRSTGCWDAWGPRDKAAAKGALDFLSGQRTGVGATGAVKATWSSGKVGMIGKSSDATHAIMAATLGHPALKSIVPIAGITDYHSYDASDYAPLIQTWQPHGNGQKGWPSVGCRTKAYPRLTTERNERGGGADNAFFRERNMVANSGSWTAATWLITGARDMNVTSYQSQRLWQALGKRGVERKLWFHQGPHTDPFDLDRQTFVTQLTAWFDKTLKGYAADTGAPVRVQRDDLSWSEPTQWPSPTTTQHWAWQGSRLAPGVAATTAPASAATVTAPMPTAPPDAPTDDVLSGEPLAKQPWRWGTVSEPLPSVTTISGTPTVTLTVKASRNALISVSLVSIGQLERAAYPATYSDGITSSGTKKCWGQVSATDSSCYPSGELSKRQSPSGPVARGTSYAGSSSSPVPGHPGWVRLAIPLTATQTSLPQGARLALLVGQGSVTGDNWEGNATNPIDVGRVGQLDLPVAAG